MGFKVDIRKGGVKIELKMDLKKLKRPRLTEQ